MTFYSLGLTLYTGTRQWTIFPLNLLLYPLLKLFRMDIPIYLVDEAAP